MKLNKPYLFGLLLTLCGFYAYAVENTATEIPTNQTVTVATCFAQSDLNDAKAGSMDKAVETLNYVGYAYDLKNPKKLLYREEHKLQMLNSKPCSRTVKYFSADDELIATKENQYYQNAAAPSFHLQDLRSNYREQAHYNNDGSLELSVQEGAAAKIQSKRINDLPEDLIVDAGFDEFVRRHWLELETGKSLSFSFASAARLDLIDFRLQQKNIDKDNLVLSMRLNSRLIAWLLDPIELTYNRQTKRLMRYRGLSNIQDDEGNTYSTDIRYHFK